jgi:hypothetical protein
VLDAVGRAEQGLGYVARYTGAVGGRAGDECVRDQLGEPFGVLRNYRAEQARVVLDQDGDVFRHRADVTPGPVVEGFEEPVAERAVAVGQAASGGCDVTVERVGDGGSEQVLLRGEMEVQAGPGDVGGPGDILHRGLPVAVTGEDRQRGLQDVLAAAGLARIVSGGFGAGRTHERQCTQDRTH